MRLDPAAVEAFERFLQQTAKGLAEIGLPVPRGCFLWSIGAPKGENDDRWTVHIEPAGLPLRITTFSGGSAAAAVAEAITSLSDQIGLIGEATRQIGRAAANAKPA